MSTSTIQIFVSSTWLDLEPERKAVETAIQRMRETKFVGMEYFGSRDETTRRASLDEVDRSEAYLGIFGGRYGSGITEDEYRRARERGLPCFIYCKGEANITAEQREPEPEKAARLAALKEELRRNHTVTEFTSPDDLAARVTADLHRWLFDEYLKPKLEAAAKENTPRPEIEALLAAIKEANALSADLMAQLRKTGYMVAEGEVIKGEMSAEVARILQESQEANNAVHRRQVLVDYLDALCVYSEQLPYISLRGKKRPLLSTIYIEQRPEEQIAQDDSTSEQDSEELELESRIETVEQALMQHRHLVIEGQPGIGKSTMLSYLALTLGKAWHQDNDTSLIPVRVFARSFASRSGSFSQCLNEQVNAELGKFLQHTLPPNLFEQAPTRDTFWLVMIDGLDEIVASEARDHLIQAIAYHAAKSESHYRYIVTTRPIADTDRFDHTYFGHYILRPFDPGQVEAFAQSWFTSYHSSQSNEADQFLLQVKESRIADLAQIPLLLTMAAIIYEADCDKVLPAYRVDLYRRFIKILRLSGNSRGTPHILRFKAQIADNLRDQGTDGERNATGL